MQYVHVKLNLGLPWQKAGSNKKKILFVCKLDLNIRKKLVKCFIWSIALALECVHCGKYCRSEMPGEFSNVVLGKDGEDFSDRF